MPRGLQSMVVDTNSSMATLMWPYDVVADSVVSTYPYEKVSMDYNGYKARIWPSRSGTMSSLSG